jgi:hypothetical protein
MSTAIHRPHFVGVARFVALAALLSVAVCSVSQDRQKAANASTANVQEQIKELISMHAKAADEANPTLASSVWCDSSEASLINPVGRWQGVEQIMGFIVMTWAKCIRRGTWKSATFPFACTRMRRGQNLSGTSQRNEERIITFISRLGNPDLSQAPRQVVLGSCSLFCAARRKEAASGMKEPFELPSILRSAVLPRLGCRAGKR